MPDPVPPIGSAPDARDDTPAGGVGVLRHDRHMTHAPAEALHDLARRLLSPDDAARWIALLRPGLRLAHAGDGPVAGRLGGLPDLPLDMPWPEGEGNGPLSHLASLDCAALTAAGNSGLALPASGTLLFFLFDGRLDDEDCMVYPSDPETRPGSRVLHVPADTPTRRHPAPAALSPYPEVALTAQAGLSVPAAIPCPSRSLMWGDAGTVYWLIRPADLAAGRFEEAMFTWQCC